VVSIQGAGAGITNINAADSLVGNQDLRTDKTTGALLYIMARVSNATLVTVMSQPEVTGITFHGNSNALNTSGCILEPGTNDPILGGFIPDQDDYKGGSADFYNVNFYGFQGFGILSNANRQRFHSVALRCVGNQLIGLEIKGNDCVVGA
jgi:hypothetical protein